MTPQADAVYLFRPPMIRDRIALHRGVLPPDRITVTSGTANVIRVVVRGIDHRSEGDTGQKDQGKANNAFSHGGSLVYVIVSFRLSMSGYICFFIFRHL